MTPPISIGGDDVSEITVGGEQVQEVTADGDVVWTASDFPPDGATAAYDFESGSGSTLVDRTGNGNDGSVTGMSWTTSTQYGDYAGSFDGTDDSVNLGSIFGSQGIQEAEFRVYPRSVPGVGTGVFDQEGSWAVFYNRGGNQSIEVAVYGDSFNHGLSMALDTWHDVYAKWDRNNEIVIEINGDRRSTSTSESASTVKDTTLAKTSGGDYIDARLDNVAFAQGSSAVLR
jgi:hypothetical protein